MTGSFLFQLSLFLLEQKVSCAKDIQRSKHSLDMPFSAPEFYGCCGIDFLHRGQMVAEKKKSWNMLFYLPRVFRVISPSREDAALQEATEVAVYLRIKLAQ